MADDPDFARFFACMNLFCGRHAACWYSADNLLLLYFGWEGVGLCSYLLIGFWYKDPANGAAARKAFIVTRVGDTAMAIALFAAGATYRQFAIKHQSLPRACSNYGLPAIAAVVMIAFPSLLGGAVGKTAPSYLCRPGCLMRWPGLHL